MYTFDEKFKKGAARAFRAQNGMTAFLGGLNKLLPEPPAFGECKTKEEEPTVARIADTAGDRWYLGFSEQSIVPRDVGKRHIISAETCRCRREGCAECSMISRCGS